MAAYIGQEKIRQSLLLQIEAATIRNAPISHFLMSGPESMGKATLAKIVANFMEVNYQVIDCGGQIKPSDLANVLKNLQAHDFLILERIELLTDTLVHVLTAPMESFMLDVIVGKGNSVNNTKLRLPVFTVVGLSSQARQISKRLQKLFLFHYEFEPYSATEISQLITLFVNGQRQTINPAAADLLANYCKGTIDDAKTLAKKVADYCLVKFRSHKIEIDYTDVVAALDYLGYFNASNSSAQITDLVLKMTGIEFENFTSDLFLRMGYKVEHTRATGDHGIDLFLRHGDETIAVQCKRWSQPVGEPIIRDFYGALLNSGVPKGLIVATTTFTQQAHSFKQGKPIDFVDIDRLVGFVKQFYPKSYN